MKQRFNFTTLAQLSLASLLVFASIVSPVASAANQDAGQALEIAPPLVNLSANPGETVKTQISLRDVANNPLIVRGEVNDFTASGEDGNPKVLLEEDEESPYSMKSWFAPLDELTLRSKQVENLTVTINVPGNAAPGGYFSVIRFTATPPDLDGQGVALSASLGALIFMRVKGDATEKMSVEEFTASKNGKAGNFFEATPLTFIARIKNEGTVHEQPVGQATIKDMFGNVVAAINFNLEGRNVLPGSIRRFESELDKSVIGDKMLFGLYTAELKVTYGTDKQSVTTSTSFWVIPWTLILAVIAVIVGGFFALRYGIRRYNERILSRARRSRR